ncbi:MAG: glycogen/starch/alpha-glucan phosphorylase, partial [Clostridia bacterium]|nr:glycogen/starch/alpha-glucan phosphorylase [Clostridia bacterium]
IARYKTGDYRAKDYYENDKDIRRTLDFITSPTLAQYGDSDVLQRLKDELISKDWYMTLLDFRSYKETKNKALSDYNDRISWARKMLINISKAVYFSSDRTIEEYNCDIWHLNQEI